MDTLIMPEAWIPVGAYRDTPLQPPQPRDERGQADHECGGSSCGGTTIGGPVPCPVCGGRNSHPHPNLPPPGGGREGGSPSLPFEGERQRGREKGQVLILAVILMAVGTLMLTPLLGQLSTTLRWGGNERDQRMKVYAAEAATSRTVADLIRGADGVATTYTTTEPHTGGTFQTYTITAAYTPPSITVNSLTPTVTLALPTASQAKPTAQQSYVDPGVTHPDLATVAPGKAYLMRLYNVKAGTLQVNWAYSPAGSAEIKIWAGIPASSGVPIPAGGRTGTISVNPTLISSSVASGATFNRTSPLTVDPANDGSGGVYTILFFNKDANSTKTTAAFAGSGGASDTWMFAKAHKDYEITASVGGITLTSYVRQVPGFTEPPAIVSAGGNSFTYTFATNNVSFITNELFAYTWLSP